MNSVFQDMMLKVCYKEPEVLGSQLVVDGALIGLWHLSFYDIIVFFKLIKWEQASTPKIPPSCLKDKAVLFWFSKDNLSAVK
jgi:hypothetical protein